jgi:hypothetical protein
MLHSWSTLGNHGSLEDFPAPSLTCMHLYTHSHPSFTSSLCLQKRGSIEGKLGLDSIIKGPVANGAFLSIFQRFLVKCQETWAIVQIWLLTSCITLSKMLDLSDSFLLHKKGVSTLDKLVNLPGPVFLLL